MEKLVEQRETEVQNDLVFVDTYDVNEKRMIRKIDWRIIPLMFFCFVLQFLDKVLINYANVMGVQKDLHMTGQDFSWMATAFFIGYIISEFPQGFLLQKFPVAKVLGINVFFWGITICCTAACRNSASIIAVRFLLGCFEAIIVPALIMVTSMWYTKREAGPRYGIWYCGLGGGQIIGGLISFGAQSGNASHTALSSWRIMFLVAGICNMLVAVAVLLWLPDSVESASFITEQEKSIVSARLAADQAGNGKKVFIPSSLWALVTDAQIWLLALLTILTTITSGVISTFSAVLIKGFGYTSKQSALLNMPSGIVSILSIMICTLAILNDFPRWISVILLLIPALLGAGLMSFLHPSNQAGCLAGIYLLNTTVATMALICSWAGGNFAGYTKRVGANAVICIAFGVGNIIGPQTFQAVDAPQYLPAKIIIFAADGAAIVVVILLRFLYGIRNRQAKQARVSLAGRTNVISDLNRGETDRDNLTFLYVL